MPKDLMSEQEMADLLSFRLGVTVSVEEVDDFLHGEFPYEQRIGIHDVLNCSRCKKETRGRTKATIRTVSLIHDISECRINDHKFEFGGPGDGYCYSHQSFDCLNNLTEEEKDAIDNAEYEEDENEGQEQG